MYFNSLSFILFFPVVALVFHLLGYRWRWIWLLAASYFFYSCWRPEFLILIIISTLTDYWAGKRMGRLKDKKSRRPYLAFSLIINLGLLGYFKYASFILDNISAVVDLATLVPIPPTAETLPPGISFYTLQTLAYSIDLYRGKMRPEQNLGRFSLYVCYFPQLVAGPIERASDLLPQLHSKKNFNFDNLKSGLMLMLWGFFKKLAVADQLSMYVNSVQNTPHKFSGLIHLISALFFTIQVYCDFSGYSDIAIGASRILGIKLSTNFKNCLLARSIPEFWRRWHITLSRWLNDYLYMPVFRALRKRIHHTGTVQFLSIMSVFLTFGLWHGPSWNFVIWGGLNGLLVFGSHLINKKLKPVFKNNGIKQYFAKFHGWGGMALRSVLNVGQIIFTFTTVSVISTFFRCQTGIHDAVDILWRIFTLQPGSTAVLARAELTGFRFGILALIILYAVEIMEYLGWKVRFAAYRSVRWAAAYGLFILVLLLGQFKTEQFVYFQF